MNLDAIGTGEFVVVDTNILVYANQQKSEECIRFLKRCAGRDLNGVVPMPMVAGLMHTLMLIEARENGWITGSNPARALAEHPELARRMTRYETQIREFLGIGLRLESVVAVDFIEAMRIQHENGLLTNDSLLLAVARRLNCNALASADSVFNAATGITVYCPQDLKA